VVSRTKPSKMASRGAPRGKLRGRRAHREQILLDASDPYKEWVRWRVMDNDRLLEIVDFDVAAQRYTNSKDDLAYRKRLFSNSLFKDFCRVKGMGDDNNRFYKYKVWTPPNNSTSSSSQLHLASAGPQSHTSTISNGSSFLLSSPANLISPLSLTSVNSPYTPVQVTAVEGLARAVLLVPATSPGASLPLATPPGAHTASSSKADPIFGEGTSRDKAKVSLRNPNLMSCKCESGEEDDEEAEKRLESVVASAPRPVTPNLLPDINRILEDQAKHSTPSPPSSCLNNSEDWKLLPGQDALPEINFDVDEALNDSVQ